MENDHSSTHDKFVNEQRAAINAISTAQFKAIKQAAAADKRGNENGVQFEIEPAGAPAHIWQKDHILVSKEVDVLGNAELQKLGAKLARNADGTQQQVSPDMARLVELPQRNDGRSTYDVVEDLNNDRDKGLMGKVARNELLYITHSDGANLCPGDEPAPLRRYPYTVPYPPVRSGNAGVGVRVTIIDTGLSPGWECHHPWLHNVNESPATDVTGNDEPGTFNATGTQIQPHAGHGMFIAGLIRCVAPRTSIKVTNTLRWAGAMHEHEVARTIMNELDSEQPPDIISLSAGCMTAGNGTLGPMTMFDVLDRLGKSDCHTLLVAAAGNDGSATNLFYPAAFAAKEPSRVVAVGALRQDLLGRACFSNWGSWVTVYEEGERLINAFPTGTFIYSEPVAVGTPPKCVYYLDPIEDGCTCQTKPSKDTVVHFDGMASWSGTSFATPLVVSRIARHMSLHPKYKCKPREAFQDLVKHPKWIKDAGDGYQLRVFQDPISS